MSNDNMYKRWARAAKIRYSDVINAKLPASRGKGARWRGRSRAGALAAGGGSRQSSAPEAAVAVL